MRKSIICITLLASVAAIGGCTQLPSSLNGGGGADSAQGSPAGGDGAPVGNPGGSGDSIWRQNITFTVVRSEAMPAQVAAILETMRHMADQKVVTVDGDTYAVITAGEKPTGGYSVEVTSIGESGGKVEVVYAIKSPSPGSMVTQALTYPSTVVKFKNPGDFPVSFKADALAK